jgi:hypothetical protein
MDYRANLCQTLALNISEDLSRGRGDSVLIFTVRGSKASVGVRK